MNKELEFLGMLIQVIQKIGTEEAHISIPLDHAELSIMYDSCKQLERLVKKLINESYTLFVE